jgi:hypothetical protein
MKNFSLILVFLIFSVSLKAQDFKEVKSAQDVIDNYLLASGGADKLSEVESISMQGKLGNGEQSGTIEIYLGKKYVYMNIKSDMFAMTQAVDIDKKKGWTKFGTMVKDMTEEEITKSKKTMEGTLWGNYLYPKENGITFEMLQNESVKGNDAFEIDLIKDGTAVSTSFFDAKTFNKVKEIKGKMISEFSNFKPTGSLGIIMPYTIKSQTGDVEITEIKFNSRFDKSLLKKPKDSDGINKEEK